MCRYTKKYTNNGYRLTYATIKARKHSIFNNVLVVDREQKKFKKFVIICVTLNPFFGTGSRQLAAGVQTKGMLRHVSSVDPLLSPLILLLFIYICRPNYPMYQLINATWKCNSFSLLRVFCSLLDVYHALAKKRKKDV